MKIGILTYHRAHNYGAFLQACSLCNKLNSYPEFQTEIIDFRMTKETKKYEIRKSSLKEQLYCIFHGNWTYNIMMGQAFEKAARSPIFLCSRNSLESDNIYEFQQFVKDKYDVIIAGSDEIWKVNNFRGFPNPYWLIGDLGCRKFSYAASARVDFHSILSSENYSLLKEIINDFEYIGVRDNYTRSEIEKLTKKEVHLCCDPVFLTDLPVEKFDFSRIRGLDQSKKNIMVMIDEQLEANKIWKQLHENFNLISVYQKRKHYYNIADLSPFDWLGLIKSVDYVIASYFHAICFSIVSNTPFLAIGTQGKKTKLVELLDTDELYAHYVNNQKSTDYGIMIKRLDTTPDYSNIVQDKRNNFESFVNALKHQGK